MVLPISAIPDPYGSRCFACNAWIDGWRPGFARFCNRCMAGDVEPAPSPKWRPPLTRATGPISDPPAEIDMVAEGWEFA